MTTRTNGTTKTHSKIRRIYPPYIALQLVAWDRLALFVCECHYLARLSMRLPRDCLDVACVQQSSRLSYAVEQSFALGDRMHSIKLAPYIILRSPKLQAYQAASPIARHATIARWLICSQSPPAVCHTRKYHASPARCHGSEAWSSFHGQMGQKIYIKRSSSHCHACAT